MSNKGLKVLSLVIAVICWYGIQGVTQSENLTYERDRDAGQQPRWRKRTVLQVHYLVDQSLQGRYSADVEPMNVSVEYETSDESPADPIADTLAAFVDCSHILKSGKYRLPVRCVATPGIRIVDISPSHVTLNIEIYPKRGMKHE